MAEAPRKQTARNLLPLTPLFDINRGGPLPLTPRLTRLYGSLRMPVPRTRPHVFSNFVTTLDGVVSLNEKGHASGGDISGFSAQDQMVMGLLRAIADAVVIGSGTLQADRRHVWTAEAIFPQLAGEYRRLRKAMGKVATPLNVIVSGGGEIDLSLPVFRSAHLRTVVLTTTAGARRLRRQNGTRSVCVREVASKAGVISAGTILDELGRMKAGKRILVEGGPRLLGNFCAERLLDEQFLTLSPQIAGRESGDGRPSLVMGKSFAPRHPLWGTLTDVRQGKNHLFLRYSLR